MPHQSREREHGTVEHLLVMPVTPFEIMASKVWSMGVLVLLACALSLEGVVKGSRPYPGFGSAVPCGCRAAPVCHDVHGHFSRHFLVCSMPQFGLLLMLVLLTPDVAFRRDDPAREHARSGPVRHAGRAHHRFRPASSGHPHRGAGLDIVWPHMLAMLAIGIAFFGISLSRFRKTIGQMA